MKYLAAKQRRAALEQEWPAMAGRELGSEQLDHTPAGYRVVACLNVWNDRAALEQTLPTWIDHVDHVIAIDGAYGPFESLSDDGTAEFLKSFPKVAFWHGTRMSQVEKRSQFFELTGEGDLLLVVDADEMLHGPLNALRSESRLDVGWVRVSGPLYQRPYGQPRVFRWQPNLHYRGRHHWIYTGDRLLATHQYGGIGFEHRLVSLSIENRRGLGHAIDRADAKQQHASRQLAAEAKLIAAPHTAMSDAKLGRRESLRIVMAAMRDDGLAPSRLHTALNRTTPHSSLLFKAEPGPFGVPEGYSTKDRALFEKALVDADIVHCHVSFLNTTAVTTKRQAVVIHHHGTHFRRHVGQLTAEANNRGALVLVSNLELLTYAPDAEFLPNTVPVARYRRLVNDIRRWRVNDATDSFRVAHSPSRREKKGTAEFLRACERLKARGYPITPVLIEQQPHSVSLAVKAACDAAFDSFWLGMQCSGIESAAMGLPVIAGDAQVAERHCQRYGYVPYTFANTEEELEHQLAKLMDDSEYRAAEATRVADHVLEHHDESAVALRYLDLLDQSFGWRTA